METFVYPTSAQLQEVDQVVLPTLTMSDPIFSHFPIVNEDAYTLIWEQQDNYVGLAAVRGLNGSPPRVRRTGAKRFTMEPGAYGEYSMIDEAEIVTRRQYGTFGQRINVTDLARKEQDRLRHRLIMRIKKILWDLSVYGVFSNATEDGKIVHQDAYTQRLFLSAVAWDTIATATPLADFRAVQLMGRGYGTAFGAGSKAYMNQQTVNWMLANTNASDLYGRRAQGLATLNTLKDVNALHAGDGLPEIVPHDDYYLADDGSTSLFIPDGYVVVFGKRTFGMDRIGDFALCANANTQPMGSPGIYTVIKETERPPKTITIDYGASGGPRIYFPGSIVVMKVK